MCFVMSVCETWEIEDIPTFLSIKTSGDSKSGVYLWRNADVQFRTAESWDTATLTVMVFKVQLFYLFSKEKKSVKF